MIFLDIFCHPQALFFGKRIFVDHFPIFAVQIAPCVRLIRRIVAAARFELFERNGRSEVHALFVISPLHAPQFPAGKIFHVVGEDKAVFIFTVRAGRDGLVKRLVDAFGIPYFIHAGTQAKLCTIGTEGLPDFPAGLAVTALVDLAAKRFAVLRHGDKALQPAKLIAGGFGQHEGVRKNALSLMTFLIMNTHGISPFFLLRQLRPLACAVACYISIIQHFMYQILYI